MSAAIPELLVPGAAIEPEDVARALSGLSDTVIASLSHLANRCERAERELERLRRAGSADGRDELLARVAELEARLAQQQPLARLGTIAGGIAHEVRTPLNAARGFAELLARHLPRAGHEQRWALRVSEAIEEIEQVTSNLLTLASPQMLTREAVEADELVQEAAASARRAVDSRTAPERWTITCRASCPRFAGDRVKLRQALRNLVANALQALPDGGRVEVRVEREGAEVALRVFDSGPGVPPHLRARVADPFFTTRAEGTGLGLALVRAIAELHGGHFEVCPTPSPLGGAEAVVRFPFEPR